MFNFLIRKATMSGFQDIVPGFQDNVSYVPLSGDTPRASDDAFPSEDTYVEFDLRSITGPSQGEGGEPMLAGHDFFHHGNKQKYTVTLILYDSQILFIATGAAINAFKNALPGMPITWTSFLSTTDMSLTMCTLYIMGIEFSAEVSEETYKFLAKALPSLSPFLSIEDHPPAGLYDRLSTPKSDTFASDESHGANLFSFSQSGVALPNQYPQEDEISKSLIGDTFTSDP